MSGAMMIPEFDHEFAETRKALERIPEDRFDWRPHEKSYALYELSAHLAEVPSWVAPTLQEDVFDLSEYQRVVPETKEQILSHFDEGVARARAALQESDAEVLGSEWTMKNGEEVVLSMPKGAVLRSFVFNHNVHHRAQLGLYLRMLDIPVPGHYGPSADEQ